MTTDPVFEILMILKRNEPEMSLQELLTDDIDEFPVSKTIKVIAGKKLAKTAQWLKAIVLIETGGRHQIRLYGWQKNKAGEWKVRQKFNISQGYSEKLSQICHAFSEFKPE
ncbi:MAG: hypothetical protein JSV04_04270 [Candidatus Heimdallarchaeota archaeon]|nr:MAG: hypothetical protein JSV04_04270 [Candidatus Heimdallarchaeota archaeon]